MKVSADVQEVNRNSRYQTRQTSVPVSVVLELCTLHWVNITPDDSTSPGHDFYVNVSHVEKNKHSVCVCGGGVV